MQGCPAYIDTRADITRSPITGVLLAIRGGVDVLQTYRKTPELHRTISEVPFDSE